jgi:hypothetical protein
MPASLAMVKQSLTAIAQPDCATRALTIWGNDMYTQVMRDQFQITEEGIVHGPTGAEFTPTLSYAESVTVWTGEIGKTLPSGESYRYADVVMMMRTLWRELHV